jgi:hypothetical protein
VRAEYDPRATIIATEAVTTGGISGFFAQRHYEVTVEVPDDTAQDAHNTFDLSTRVGIAALLEDADNAELNTHYEPAAPTLSTASVDFAAIMADLTRNITVAPEALSPDGPEPLTGAGDLVAIIGLGDDPLRVARRMVEAVGDTALRTASDLSVAGVGHVDDRRTLLAARAAGVEGNHSIVVAFRLNASSIDVATTDAIRRLQADQLWVVVDVSRKTSDTEGWVRGVQAAVAVDGVTAWAREFTLTPESVTELGLPVRWVEPGSVG